MNRKMMTWSEESALMMITMRTMMSKKMPRMKKRKSSTPALNSLLMKMTRTIFPQQVIFGMKRLMSQTATLNDATRISCRILCLSSCMF